MKPYKKNKSKENMSWILPLFLSIILLILPQLAYSQVHVTVFNASLSRLSLTFPRNDISSSFFIVVPNGTISQARMRIEGFNLQGQNVFPADVMLVTDISASMDDNCAHRPPWPTDSPCKINDAKAADISFLNNVDLDVVHVGLTSYSYCPTLSNVERLTNDWNVLNSTISQYRIQSTTNMARGMELAIDELRSIRHRTGVKRYIIIMTDGVTNTWTTPTGYCNNSGAGGQAQQAVRDQATRARNNNITIFSIAFGVCNPASNRYNQSGADCFLTNQIADMTGGQSYNTSDPDTLKAIYEMIAEKITVTNFSTPTISSTTPLSLNGWWYSAPYSGNALWNGTSCGDISANCGCIDFRSLVQSNLGQCTAYPCNISFSVYSSTVGMLNLSDLYIEINEPPISNYPPTGTCMERNISCGQTELIIPLDNGLMVNDANDDLSTLSWRFDSNIGTGIWNNTDFNTTRQLVFRPDPNNLANSYWETFIYNVSDPWNASTLSCINVSYAGCVLPVCGNNITEFGEQCELNNTQNNSYCSQSMYNCSAMPQVMTRDEFGNCGPTCQCINDSWSLPTCIYGNCTANCTTGTSHDCTLPGNIPGTQTCNTTTCNWDACIPNQVLSIGDTTISFDYSYRPNGGYDYNLSNMLSQYAILPGPANTLKFVIETISANFSINPNPPAGINGSTKFAPLATWFLPTSEQLLINSTILGDDGNIHTSTAILTVIYTGEGAPQGEITCSATAPGYLLSPDSSITIPLDDVFNFTSPECFTSSGACGVVSEISSPDISVQLNAPYFIVNSGSTVPNQASITVSSSSGISATCPVRFLNLNLNCDKPNCKSCPDANCLLDHPEWECLDYPFVMVTNPFAIFKPSSRLPNWAPSQYSITSVDITDGFEIEKISADDFHIKNNTDIATGTQGAAMFQLKFDGYDGNARICPPLWRVNYNIGENSFDPNSTLLITGARAALGFYEIDGIVFSRGPYIFIAKVWLRE
jgi:hypothetical protein